VESATDWYSDRLYVGNEQVTLLDGRASLQTTVRVKARGCHEAP
jgi:hypothetical protein